ncbi:MAG: GNAT family N-acetyltransferase, partial [Thermoplasmata archaeon]|nr:GNAT family N-acetyltransferase [Thermoplasmata archaeon]
MMEGCKKTARLMCRYSVKDVARDFRHLVNCDPYEDVVMAEAEGEMIGFQRVWWFPRNDCYTYHIQSYLLPEWRGRGIRRAMLQWGEGISREKAASHPTRPKVYDIWLALSEEDLVSLLEAEGYAPSRYFFEMLRPNMDDIPDLPLPEGLEVRPVPPEEYGRLWKVNEEIFQDHWGARPYNDEEFKNWKEDPLFQPELWQVAWDGDEMAGMVLSFIDEEENREYGRTWGYPDDIGVRRPYRRKGLARALLARALEQLKEHGMEQANLGVDSENPAGAL